MDLQGIMWGVLRPPAAVREQGLSFFHRMIRSGKWLVASLDGRGGGGSGGVGNGDTGHLCPLAGRLAPWSCMMLPHTLQVLGFMVTRSVFEL